MTKYFFLSFIITVITTYSSYGQTSPKFVKSEIKTKVYCDHCNKCGSCGVRLNKGLQRLKGFNSLSLDQEKMIFTITYDSTILNILTVKKEISLMGFDAGEIPADPKAYKKLAGCCKK